MMHEEPVSRLRAAFEAAHDAETIAEERLLAADREATSARRAYHDAQEARMNADAAYKLALRERARGTVAP